MIGRTKLATIATVLLFSALQLQCCTAAPTVATDACSMMRPKSTRDCDSSEKKRRFFYKSSDDAPRCKPFGVCPEDADMYDQQLVNGDVMNYFRYNSDCETACVRGSCPSELTIANGRVTISTSGTEAQYTCNEGYMLNGSHLRTCLPNSTWSGEQPVCQEVVCPNQDTLPNGTVSLTELTLGSEVTYQCNQGFVLEGDSSRTCLSNATWSGTRPSCTIVQCPVLQTIANGKLNGNRNTFGAVVTYSCIEGYGLHGSQIRTCGEDAVWSGEEPTCIVALCPEPAEISNGAMTVTSTTYGATITYNCIVGFTLQGPHSRTCQSNGTWSGEVPVCTASCTPPPRVDNTLEAESTISATYQHGEKFIYTCIEGFQFSRESNPVITCQNGSWSQPPTCTETRPMCPEPDVVVVNGVVSAPCLEPQCKATYTCDESFMLIGEGIRTCGNDRRWDHEAPKCAKVDLKYGENCVSNERLIIMDDTRSVSIKCLILPVGATDQTPVWTCDGGALPAHVVVEPSGILKIPNINLETAMNYTCHIGDLAAFVKIEISNRNTTKPHVPATLLRHAPIQPVNSRLGDTGELFLCIFKGCPQANVTWKRNGQVLSPDDPTLDILDSTTSEEEVISALTINHVTQEHEGVYECIGENSAGTASANMSLVVVPTRKRRSVSNELSGREPTPKDCNFFDPESVTLVAKVRRSPKQISGASPVRVEVTKVLRDSSGITKDFKKNKLIRTVLGPAHDRTSLSQDTTHILTGRVAGHKLHLVSDSTSILPYSVALESAISLCR